jgi:hypothetical protein
MNNRKRVLVGVFILVAFVSSAFLSATVYSKRCSQIQGCPHTSESCSGDRVIYEFCTIYCDIAQNPPERTTIACEMPLP